MPPSLNRSMTPAEWALIFALSSLWGASYFFVAIAIIELSPITIVTLRVMIAGALLYAIIRIMGRTLPTDRTSWRDFLLMGLINNVVPFSLIAWSQGYIVSGLASILNATTPFFTVLVAHFLTTDEKTSLARIVGVIIGLAGVTIMIGPSFLLGLGGELLPELACLGAALAYAVSAVFARRFARRGITPVATATGQMAGASALMIPLWLIIDQPWALPLPSASTISAILALAAVSTVLAYFIYYRILATAGAVNLALVTLLIPVSAILLGALILSERLEIRHFIGMTAIALGLAVIDGRLPRMLVSGLRAKDPQEPRLGG